MKKIIFSFGRFNPPHIGHEKLIKKVHERAAGEDHVIIASASFDHKNNPLAPDIKYKHLCRIFPNTNIIMACDEFPTFFHHIKRLNGLGYTEIEIVAGADRVSMYQTKLYKYNGNLFQFENIDTVGIDRNMTDISASLMRSYVRKNDFTSFKNGLPLHVSEQHAYDLFDDVHRGMRKNDQIL